MYKNLSTENDQKAKDILIRVLTQTEFSVTENPDNDGVDILVGSPPHTGLILEVKQDWTGVEFPFPDINIPPRKIKYVGPDNYFCILSGDMSRCALVYSGLLLDQDMADRTNVYSPAGEEFIKIPLDRAVFYNLK